MQIVRSSADDIDFSTPNAVDPANNFGTLERVSPLLDTVRYPTDRAGTRPFGYGRINVYEMLKAVRDRRIPPEAMIDGPTWFDVLPAPGTRRRHRRASAAARADVLRLPGRVGARAAAAARTRPPTRGPSSPTRTGPAPPRVAARWRPSTSRRSPRRCPTAATGAPVDPTDRNRPDEERFSVRLRVVVTAHGGDGDGLTRRDAEAGLRARRPRPRRPGFPHRIAGRRHGQPVVRRPRRRRHERAGARHRRRRDPRLPGPDGSELPGFPRARPTRVAVVDHRLTDRRGRRHRRPTTARSASAGRPSATSTATAPARSSPPTSTATCTCGRRHRRPAGHDARRPGLLARRRRRPGRAQPHQARLRRRRPSLGDLDGDGDARDRRRPPSTATSTPGTTTARPVDGFPRAASSTRPRWRRSTR